MGLGPVAFGVPASAAPSGAAAAPGSPAPTAGFAAVLGQAVDALNGAQLGADRAAQALAAGSASDLATAVIAAEKANLLLSLAVQLRNEAVGAYQQLMQMQV
jgi:flagellar hook-basal body complex protein FliE